MTYPASADGLDTGPFTGSLGAEGHSSLHEGVAGAIQDIAGVLGDDPAGSYADVETRLDDTVIATNGGYEKVSVIASASGSVALDFDDGNVFDVTLTGNTTFSFSNLATSSTRCASFMVLVTQDGSGGRTITWPTVSWTVETPSPATTANTRHLYVFTVFKAGTLVVGTYSGQLT